ncbi:MAG: thioredoxin [Phycisphaerae bacterium]|nr:thioredoxin [Phycisphaerae bacterium]
MAKNVMEFNRDNFESEVLESDVPVVVDFWAEWCGPCRALTPIVEQLAGEVQGKAKVGKVDIQSERSLATDHGITSIPTIIIFKDGEPAKQFIGLTSLKDLKSAVDAVA